MSRHEGIVRGDAVTDRRDPIESWLSSDVELMPPPPGTFERVHRRARHRRAMKAMSAAAGAAVIVVAGVVIPQVAGGLLSSSPAPAVIKMTPGPTQTAPASTVSIPGPPLSTAGRGPAPAAGFQPTSVTFIGGTIGAVLGEAGSCGTGPCTAMAGTHDYGKNWTEIGAPAARSANGNDGVSQVRFLNREDGWAYGPALYATHNGGKTWRAIGTRGGRVIDLSTVGRRAFAVVGSGCAGVGAQYASGCKRFTLFSAAASSNVWDAVRGASGTGQALPGGLQLTSKRGYLLAGGRLYSGPIKNGPWQRVSSAPVPHCLKSGGSGPHLIAPTTSDLLMVCQDPTTGVLTLFQSPNSDSTWRQRGIVQATGIAQSFAVTPSGTMVLASTAGIYRSTDGRTWNPTSVRTPAGGFSFVGMTTDSKGVAVAASLRPALYITTDGGRTWRARPVR